jgi:hypothetical protein
MARLACAALLLAVLIAGCGGGTTTVTETRTQAASTGDVTTAAAPTTPTVTARTGNQGPHYFETPSHNIGCYVSAHDARCDIRERDWSPPPEPRSCKKIGLDYGQGIVVGPHRAEFICAGDTALGGKAVLGYGHTAQRGSLNCVSSPDGITCTNLDTRHGFALSRQGYRIF